MGCRSLSGVSWAQSRGVKFAGSPAGHPGLSVGWSLAGLGLEELPVREPSVSPGDGIVGEEHPEREGDMAQVEQGRMPGGDLGLEY